MLARQHSLRLRPAHTRAVRVLAGGSGQYGKDKRRRGRPAWKRTPYDSPLRDGNRDRLIGLLTERATKTLLIYLMELNGNLYSWLLEFYKAHRIPKEGSWDEVSGEAFLRRLLSMPVEEARVHSSGRESMFDLTSTCDVDPRNIAQRIMEIRTQLAAEFVQDLSDVSEENSILLRETLVTSLDNTLQVVESPPQGATHPELLEMAPKAAESAAAPAMPMQDEERPSPEQVEDQAADGGATQVPDEARADPAPPMSDGAANAAVQPTSSSAGKESSSIVEALNAAFRGADAKHPTVPPPADVLDAASANGPDLDVVEQLKRALSAETVEPPRQQQSLRPELQQGEVPVGDGPQSVQEQAAGLGAEAAETVAAPAAEAAACAAADGAAAPEPSKEPCVAAHTDDCVVAEDLKPAETVSAVNSSDDVSSGTAAVDCKQADAAPVSAMAEARPERPREEGVLIPQLVPDAPAPESEGVPEGAVAVKGGAAEFEAVPVPLEASGSSTILEAVPANMQADTLTDAAALSDSSTTALVVEVLPIVAPVAEGLLPRPKLPIQGTNNIVPAKPRKSAKLPRSSRSVNVPAATGNGLPGASP